MMAAVIPAVRWQRRCHVTSGMCRG
jgi:hypothetical protein